MLGITAAYLLHPQGGLEQGVPPVISELLPEPEPPPPSRDELVVFKPDQTMELLRADGSQISVGYHSAVVDPRWIAIDFFAGWNREMDTNEDGQALLFTSGPTFARGQGNGELGMVLHGDLMLGNGTWRAGNLTAARERAWMGITKDGRLEFGYAVETAGWEASQPPVRFTVTGIGTEGNRTPLWTRTIDPGADERDRRGHREAKRCL